MLTSALVCNLAFSVKKDALVGTLQSVFLSLPQRTSGSNPANTTANQRYNRCLNRPPVSGTSFLAWFFTCRGSVAWSRVKARLISANHYAPTTFSFFFCLYRNPIPLRLFYTQVRRSVVVDGAEMPLQSGRICPA